MTRVRLTEAYLDSFGQVQHPVGALGTLKPFGNIMGWEHIDPNLTGIAFDVQPNVIVFHCVYEVIEEEPHEQRMDPDTGGESDLAPRD